MKKLIKILALCITVLLVLLCTTQPSRIPAAVLIVPFGLFFISVALSLIAAFGLLYGTLSSKALRCGFLAAMPPTLLLILQSAGQLNTADILMLLALCALTYFYVSRLNPLTR